ncbi:MAG: hypothetical protein N4A33_04025 [Bacteriovoracaceae bacterium]|jgi:hypothetical protein|nr:hypothetical protein [Bacteriovoracaceae bacterium]
MLKKKTNEMTLIIKNNDTGTSRFYVLNKKLLKKAAIISSTIILILVFGSILLTSIMRKRLVSRENKIPVEILNLNKIIKDLSSRLADEKELTTALQQNISRKNIQNINSINHISIPATGLDKRKDALTTIEQIEIDSSGDLNTVSFNIKNNTNDKIAGYFFIITFYNNQTSIYPRVNSQKATYSQGEPFTISKFKPVKITLDSNLDDSEVKYKIMLFSRVGDLIGYSSNIY